MEFGKNPFRKKEETEEIKETVEEKNEETVEELNEDNTSKDNENIEIEEENNNEVQEEKIEEQEVSQEKEQDNELEEKYNDLNNKYLRLAADFDNFRKRTQQEKEELSKYTTAKLLKEIVNVVDTFDRACEHLKEIEDSKTIKEGYEVALKQFQDTLKKIGLVEIESLGKEFNPNEHEAITQIPTQDYEPDTIAYVAQKGYKYEDKIVRPALVGVAKKIEE